jgi:hypothetical protein
MAIVAEKKARSKKLIAKAHLSKLKNFLALLTAGFYYCCLTRQCIFCRLRVPQAESDDTF